MIYGGWYNSSLARARLLLWIAISFVFLAVNNFFLFADTTLTPPHIDLSPLRVISGFWRFRS